MGTRSTAALAVSLTLLLVVPAPGADEKIEAITKPSEDRILSFIRAGQVAEVSVKEGDTVRVDQELVRLDDSAERIQLEQLEAQATDRTRIEAAQAQLDQAKVVLRKTEEARKKGAATELEVEKARLDVVIANLSLTLARFNQMQDQRKLREAKAQMERMKLKSPIDGKVEKVLVEPGESADALEKIVRVVKIDPLWVDAPVPLAVARGLSRDGGKAVVEFESPETGRIEKATGKITHIAAVADPASGTLTVRVEVPNAAGRPAGEHVYVSFPDVGKAASGQAPARTVAKSNGP